MNHKTKRFHVAMRPAALSAALILALLRLAVAAEPLPIELTLVDGDAIAFATFSSHNQKVVANEQGLFITHIHQANKEYTAQQWRLSRSSDGGKSFSTVYKATDATNPPPLETDAQSVVYAARPDFLDGHAYLYRFDPGDFSKPAITPIPEGSGGKFCLALDSGRRQLYWFSNNGAFRAVGMDGKVGVSLTLLKAGPHAGLQYPLLTVDPGGMLYAAWTTNTPDRYLYWDIHALRSPDGGRTWQTLAGKALEPPIVADDTGPADRISHDDEFDVHSWLSALLVNDDKLHFVYWAKTEPQRQRYVRYDARTGAREIDLPRIFGDRPMKEPNDSGALIADRRRPGAPLYFVSTVDDRKRLACLVSTDNGGTWREHALGSELFRHRVYAIGAAREVTQDGWIIGTFTDVDPKADLYTEPGTGKVYFFRIRAR